MPAPDARSRLRRLVGFTLGLLLIAAACVVAMRSGLAGSTLDALASPSGVAVLLAVAALTAASVFLAGLTFWALLRPHADLGYREMTALIASSALLNYLPLWPGLVGRVAYHRQYHGITVARSLIVLVWSRVLTAWVAVAAVAALFSPTLAAVLAALGLLTVLLAGQLTADRPLPLLAAAASRAAELALMAGRYALCLPLADIEPDPALTIALAGIAMFVQAIPLAPNGLGLREWAIALFGRSVSTGFTLAAFVLVDLLNRLGEIIAILPAGLIATALLARRRGAFVTAPR